MPRIVAQPTLFTMLDDLQRRLAALEGLTGGGGTTTGAPAFSYGINNIAGSSDVATAIDSTLAVFDDLSISTSLPGDIPAPGGVAFAPRRDHRHGREQPSGIFNIFDYGAVGDCTLIGDASVVAGQAVITSPSGGFANAQPGMLIGVNNAGSLTPAYTEYSTTILSVQSATQVIASSNATTTANTSFCGYGSDNLAAINNAVLDAAAGGGRVLVPPGAFAASGVIRTGGASNLEITGLGMGISRIYGFHQDDRTFVLSFNGGTHVACRNLSLGSIPVSSRDTTGSALSVQANRFLVEAVEVAVPGITASCGEAGIVVHNLVSNTLPQAGPGLIRGCHIQNTLADGIYTQNCQGVRIIGNHVENAGDDSISIHSQNPDGAGNPQPNLPQTNTVVVGNTIRNGSSGGISANGADGLVISGNVIDRTWGANLRLRSNAWGSNGNQTYGDLLNVVIVGNRLNGAGEGPPQTYPGSGVAGAQSHPAGIQLTSQHDSSTTPPIVCNVSNILAADNLITTPRGAYIYATGEGSAPLSGTMQLLSIKQNHCSGASEQLGVPHAGCVVTSGSPVVLDAAVTRSDAGAAVIASSNPGIPAGAKVGSVVPGISFHLQNAGGTDLNATASNTRTLTLTKQYPPTGVSMGLQGHEAAQVPGIYLYYASNCRVNDNFLNQSMAEAIYIDPSCVDPLMVSNNSSTRPFTNTAGYAPAPTTAISLSGNQRGVLVNSNKINDPAGNLNHCIDMGNCTGVCALNVFPSGKPVINGASALLINNVAS